ncbi:MAG: hypothetical protein ACLTZY_03475 [Alistipes indistinctus]
MTITQDRPVRQGDPRDTTYHDDRCPQKYNDTDEHRRPGHRLLRGGGTPYHGSIIRHDIDKLELIVDDELWPLPQVPGDDVASTNDRYKLLKRERTIGVRSVFPHLAISTR